MNLYQTLGVNPDATPDEIKRAYKKLCQKAHPDKGGDAERFQEIEEAYRILKDAARREQYDSTGSTQQTDDRAQARGIIAGVFTQQLASNKADPSLNYVRLVRDQVAQRRESAFTISNNIKALIVKTEGETFLGVLNQQLQGVDAQLQQLDISLEMLEGCKCGEELERLIIQPHFVNSNTFYTACE